MSIKRTGSADAFLLFLFTRAQLREHIFKASTLAGMARGFFVLQCLISPNGGMIGASMLRKSTPRDLRAMATDATMSALYWLLDAESGPKSASFIAIFDFIDCCDVETLLKSWYPSLCS